MQKLLLLTIVLIVYGSLYPWEFRPGPLPSVAAVIGSWSAAFVVDRFIVRDLFINVVLYMPVGVFGYLAFVRSSPAIRYAGPVVLGGILAALMEIAQLLTVRRHSNLLDIVTNTAGAAIGVTLAHAGSRAHYFRVVRTRLADRGAAALLVCGATYLLFPFFPIFGRTALRHKLDVFAESPWFELVAFVSAAVAWFLVGRLLAAAKVPSVPAWLTVAAAIALPAQMLVLSRQPVLASVTGAAAGLILFYTQHHSSSAWFDACAVGLLLIVRGLAPFHLTASTNSFTWSPFGGVLGFNDWQNAMLIVLEKSFFYGAAVWTLHRTGIGLWKATAITAGTLAMMEVAQVHLPGRTPEITDVILPMLIGLGSYWAGRHPAAAKA